MNEDGWKAKCASVERERDNYRRAFDGADGERMLQQHRAEAAEAKLGEAERERARIMAEFTELRDAFMAGNSEPEDYARDITNVLRDEKDYWEGWNRRRRDPEGGG